MIRNFTNSRTASTRYSSLHLAKKSIGNFGLIPRSATSRTGFECNALRLFKTFDFDFFGCSVHHFFQIQLYANAQIRTFHSTRTALLTESTSKSTSESTSKNIAEMRENIFHIHSTTTAKSAGTAYACVTVLVIASFFLWITQNLISFGRFFKLFFGFFIARIFVRVIFYGLFAVSFFDFLCSS